MTVPKSIWENKSHIVLFKDLVNPFESIVPALCYSFPTYITDHLYVQNMYNSNEFVSIHLSQFGHIVICYYLKHLRNPSQPHPDDFQSDLTILIATFQLHPEFNQVLLQFFGSSQHSPDPYQCIPRTMPSQFPLTFHYRSTITNSHQLCSK